MCSTIRIYVAFKDRLDKNTIIHVHVERTATHMNHVNSEDSTFTSNLNTSSPRQFYYLIAKAQQMLTNPEQQ
uniref:Uncharacterized protein n=1 Tax=Anguilla anguilla TaxID=7936 RepID=A0A0E9PXR3_ANGAN